MLIAHDLGTTGNKASLHDDGGRLVASLTHTYATDFGPGGVAEQNPEDWWAAVCAATRHLLQETGTPPADISGVGLSGQMMGATFLGADLTPLRNAIIWADHRSGRQCRTLLDAIGMEEGYRLTGHRLNPTYSLTKVMWVRDNEPDTFAKVRHVCLAKDFVVHRLTGRLATDPSDASSTNAYDQLAGVWAGRLLEAAALPPDIFPDIVPSTTVVGGVTAEAASASGLLQGTPVVMGGGDGPLAAVGAGVVSPESGAYVYLGSSSWVSLAADQPLYDPGMRTMTFDHVVPGRFVPTATMVAGGGSLHWVTDVLAPGDDADRFRRVVDEADVCEGADDGLFFLPHLLGERSPYWNPAAKGAFIGLSRHHGPGHLARAVLEGVAFNLATCVEAFRSSGAAIDRVDAIGGGAASDLWLQIFADAWGAVVRRRTIVEEANSLGAAVTAGVGIGALEGFDVAASLSEVTAEFHPRSNRHAVMRQRHEQFLDAYQRLEPWFEASQR